MDLQEEFKDTVEKISQGNLKLLSSTLKDLGKTPEDFLVFYSTLMTYSGQLDYAVYRSLIAPLNNFNFIQEIPKLYIKIISTLMNTQKDTDILDFLTVIYFHPISHLKKIFSTPSNSCLQTSLVMFGEYLFLKGWMYESYKAMYVGSLSITLTGIFPSKEIMTKYLTVISCYFLKEGYFYSFLNAISRLKKFDSLESFGSKRQFEKIAKYCEYKNEGMEFSQLLCKMPYTKEDLEDIETTNEEGYIAEYVDFCKWDYYIKVVGSEVEIHDLSFVSFLKRNSIEFEIEDKKVKVGEYKFRSISDSICDIIEYYTPKKDKSVKDKLDRAVEKSVETISISKQVKKKLVKFRDIYISKKAKFTIYCEIFSKLNKEVDLKNEERDQNRRERFIKLQKEQESRKNDLKKYSEILEELREMLKAKEVKQDRKEIEYKSPTVRKVSKTSWRDMEVEREPIVRSRSFRREEDILSTRNISSFEKTTSCEKTSTMGNTTSNIYRPPPPSAVLKNTTSNIYRPPPPSTVLKNFNKEPPSSETKSNVYVPPHLRKNTSNSSEEKKKPTSHWRDA